MLKTLLCRKRQLQNGWCSTEKAFFYSDIILFICCCYLEVFRLDFLGVTLKVWDILDLRKIKNSCWVSAVPLVKCLGWVCGHGFPPFCTLGIVRVWLLGSVCGFGLIFVFGLSSRDPNYKELSRRNIKLLLLYYWFFQLRASRSLVPWVTLSPAEFHTPPPSLITNRF